MPRKIFPSSTEGGSFQFNIIRGPKKQSSKLEVILSQAQFRLPLLNKYKLSDKKIEIGKFVLQEDKVQQIGPLPIQRNDLRPILLPKNIRKLDLLKPNLLEPKNLANSTLKRTEKDSWIHNFEDEVNKIEALIFRPLSLMKRKRYQ